MSECTSSNGLVVRWTFVRMNFCLCLACTHTSHIVSSCVKPSIGDRNAAEWRWARRRCHRRDSETEMGAGLAEFWLSTPLFLFFPLVLEVGMGVGEMSAGVAGEVSAGGGGGVSAGCAGEMSAGGGGGEIVDVYASAAQLVFMK